MNVIKYAASEKRPFILEVGGYCQAEATSFGAIAERAKILGLRDVSIEASCGCPACDNGVQAGHFACDAPPDWAIEQESAGRIARHFDGTSWTWEVR